MRRLLTALSVVLVTSAFLATPASAQQSLSLFVGGFAPLNLNARSNQDVLANNLGCGECFDFRIHDFDGAMVGADWLFGMGDKFEGGLGVGFYQRSVPSVYANFTNADRSEIQQDLKLRVVPFTATIRFVPTGRHSPIQPYIGAGVGVYAWRYTESGTFIDFSTPNRALIGGTFTGSGSATGPVVLGGVRVPLGSVAIGGEIRYQTAQGTLPGDQGFAGSKIDLGGMTYLFVVNVSF